MYWTKRNIYHILSYTVYLSLWTCAPEGLTESSESFVGDYDSAGILRCIDQDKSEDLRMVALNTLLSLMIGGCLASKRDDKLPQPWHFCRIFGTNYSKEDNDIL